MADILVNIIQFADIDPDAQATLPHRLNVDGVPQTPDIIFVDNGNFSVTGDATDVTITNDGGEVGSVNVLATHWHTFLRVFGVEGQKALSVQPYIPAGGGGGAGMDELVRITGDDEVANFLAAKLTNGPGVVLTILDPGGNEQIEISSPGALDELVKVSGDDTTPGMLNTKLTQGDGIGLTVKNPGANESVVISAATGAPITVRGDTNDIGAGTIIARAAHKHRLEYEVEDEGVLVSARPRMDFVGVGVGAVDVPGEDLTRVTIPGGDIGDGAVVERSTYVAASSSTSGNAFVDGMAGLDVTVPINGDYWAIWEGEFMNTNANAVLEVGVSVNSVLAVVANSERSTQGNANDMGAFITTIELGTLVAGDLVRGLFRKASGSASVSLSRRNLTIFKVQ